MAALHESDFAARLIKNVARGMVGKTSLLADDVPDLQQDLWLHLLENIHHYCADRGHARAFITKVVKNKAASILAARAAEKRGGGSGCVSLNEEFEDDDGELSERHEAITVDDFLRLARGTIRSELARLELAMDVRKIIEQLPAHQYVICLLLIDKDQCAVANVVGLPRSTLRDLIKRLRKIARGAGLEDYFR